MVREVNTKNNASETLVKFIDFKEIEHHLGAPIDHVSEFRKGNINKNFLLRSSNRHFIFKIYSDRFSFVSTKLNPEGRARAEFQALQFCESNNLGAPRPIALFGNAVLMTQISGSPLTEFPLTKNLISLIISWLLKFHSIEVPASLLENRLVNAPLLGAFRNLQRYISDNPTDNLAKEIKVLLKEVSNSHSVPKPISLIHGDPTLRNWLIENNQVYGTDFEFSNPGNPLFEIGLLLTSILDHGEFFEESYGLCQYAIDRYLKSNSEISIMDIQLGTLCGLILVAVTVPQSERRQRIFSHTRKTLAWIEDIGRAT